MDRLAQKGNSSFHTFPRTRLKGYDWSFSGIKTSGLYSLNAFPEDERSEIIREHLPDLCASFQEAIVDMLVAPVKKAMRDTGIRDLGLVGGVSANARLRERLGELCTTQRGALYVPPLEYCMDNAAMIAMAGHHRLQSGQTSPLTVSADPSLTLT